MLQGFDGVNEFVAQFVINNEEAITNAPQGCFGPVDNAHVDNVEKVCWERDGSSVAFGFVKGCSLTKVEDRLTVCG